MNLVRSILAIVFAIVIANPACCCAMPGQADQVVKTSHCCEEKSEGKQQAPKACACPAKDHRMSEDPLLLPSFTAIELPPVLPTAERVALPEVPVCEIAPPDFRIDTGPPRQRLVMLQRFLI